MKFVTINIARDFSKFPGGRYESDGPFSACLLRKNIIQFFEKRNGVILELDGVLGYASSFLEEVFGGLVRQNYTQIFLDQNLILKSDDDFLIQEIQSYMKVE